MSVIEFIFTCIAAIFVGFFILHYSCSVACAAYFTEKLKYQQKLFNLIQRKE